MLKLELKDDEVAKLKKLFPRYSEGYGIKGFNNITEKAHLDKVKELLATAGIGIKLDTKAADLLADAENKIKTVVGDTETTKVVSKAADTQIQVIKETREEMIVMEGAVKLAMYLDLLDLAKEKRQFTGKSKWSNFEKCYDDVSSRLQALSKRKVHQKKKEAQPANETGSWSAEFETKGTSKGKRTKTDVKYNWSAPVVKSSRTETRKQTGSKRSTFFTDEQKKKITEENKKINDMTAVDKAKLILDYVKKLQEMKKKIILEFFVLYSVV